MRMISLHGRRSRAALVGVLGLSLIACADDKADEFVAAAELADAGVQSLLLDTGGAAVVVPEASVSWKASGVRTDGSTVDYSAVATWASADPAVATVSAGKVTGVSEGETSISVSYGPFAGSASVSVSIAALQSITLEPASVSLNPCSSVEVNATGNYDDGTSLVISDIANWSSGDAGVISVESNDNSGAELYSHVSGATEITVSHDGVSQTLPVTITNTLSDIAVTPATATLVVGDTREMTATAEFSDDSERDISTRATWALNDPVQSTIITVDERTVTAVGAGTASVKATCGGVTTNSPAVITVNAAE